MPLTEDQRIAVRRQVGNVPDDATLDVIYDRHLANGVADPSAALVLEVLEIRLAEIKRNPSQFAVPGEYSEGRSDEQMKALEAQITALGGTASVGGFPFRVVPPPDAPCR